MAINQKVNREFVSRETNEQIPDLQKPSMCIIAEQDGVVIMAAGQPFMSFPGCKMNFSSYGIEIVDKKGETISTMRSGQDGCWSMRVVGVEFYPALEL